MTNIQKKQISKVMSHLSRKRWKKMTKEERSQYASKIAKIRWQKSKLKLSTDVLPNELE